MKRLNSTNLNSVLIRVMQCFVYGIWALFIFRIIIFICTQVSRSLVLYNLISSSCTRVARYKQQVVVRGHVARCWYLLDTAPERRSVCCPSVAPRESARSRCRRKRLLFSARDASDNKLDSISDVNFLTPQIRLPISNDPICTILIGGATVYERTSSPATLT